MNGGEEHLFSIQLNDVYNTMMEFAVRRKGAKLVQSLHSLAASKSQSHVIVQPI